MADREVLTRIAELDPDKDSEQGYTDEWGEAECFHKARDAAREAVAQPDHLAVLLERVEAVLSAYAARWVRVDCTPDEERTLRDLNDYLNVIDPSRREVV